MSDGLRKVVHIEVFDFKEDPAAYAINTGKNQFGYKYYTNYIDKDKIVKQSPKINNVEKASKLYRLIGLNISQMNSLRKRVRRITKKGMVPFTEDDHIRVVVRGGSSIVYRGQYQEDFYQKVLQLK